MGTALVPRRFTHGMRRMTSSTRVSELSYQGYIYRDFHHGQCQDEGSGRAYIEENGSDDVANKEREEDWYERAGKVCVGVLHRIRVERKICHEQRYHTCAAHSQVTAP